jgi:hypothetical protein
MTTNLEGRSAGFLATELPQTLQDAIHVVRELSIQYIWIDMICIVQDDTNDWENEAQNMSNIYQNAYFTICPTAAWSFSDSFLRRPDCCSLVMPFTVSKPGSIEQKGVFYARFPWRAYTPALIDNSRWKKRGWTLREQILSTRMLYVTDDIIYFECLTLQEVENTAYGLPDALSIPWLPEKKSKKENHHIILQMCYPASQIMHIKPYLDWYSIVEEYSRRELSCAGDKLPALSGLAHKFARAIDGVYLAGLWRGDLWRGIMWKPQFEDGMKQPPKYRAPSWSWAALDGAVIWFASFVPDPTLDIQSVDITLSVVDTMGRVTGGQLVVSGKLLAVENFVPNPSQWEEGSCEIVGEGPEAYGEVKCDMTSGLSLDSGIMALAIVYTDQYSRGILLQPTRDQQEGSKVYCRLALFCCHSDKSLDVEPSVVKII